MHDTLTMYCYGEKHAGLSYVLREKSHQFRIDSIGVRP